MRRRAKRPAPVESPYTLEVRQQLADSQRASLRQAQAEDFAQQDQLARVVDIDPLAQLHRERDDDQPAWRPAS
jgi:DNA-binding XRE family transcriptional regulator